MNTVISLCDGEKIVIEYKDLVATTILSSVQRKESIDKLLTLNSVWNISVNGDDIDRVIYNIPDVLSHMVLMHSRAHIGDVEK